MPGQIFLFMYNPSAYAHAHAHAHAHLTQTSRMRTRTERAEFPYRIAVLLHKTHGCGRIQLPNVKNTGMQQKEQNKERKRRRSQNELGVVVIDRLDGSIQKTVVILHHRPPLSFLHYMLHTLHTLHTQPTFIRCRTPRPGTCPCPCPCQSMRCCLQNKNTLDHVHHIKPHRTKPHHYNTNTTSFHLHVCMHRCCHLKKNVVISRAYARSDFTLE